MVELSFNVFVIYLLDFYNTNYRNICDKNDPINHLSLFVLFKLGYVRFDNVQQHIFHLNVCCT